MPVQLPEMKIAALAPSSDVFLHVQTKRAGKVKGESQIAGHIDDIVVNSWQWGLAASSAIGSTQAGSRRSYTALTVRKNIDAATTALMSALATNDEVKEAKLTMRRAGGSQEDYFLITLKGARVSGLTHATAPDGTTQETVNIVFTKVDVEYKPQKDTGLKGGSTTFSDELVEAA